MSRLCWWRASVFEILFIVFLVLKLTDVIDWSWWWVTAPLWLAVIWYVFLFFWNVVLFSIVSKEVNRGFQYHR